MVVLRFPHFSYFPFKTQLSKNKSEDKYKVVNPPKYFCSDIWTCPAISLSICFSVRQWLLETGWWLLGGWANAIQASARDSHHRPSVWRLEAGRGRPCRPCDRRLRRLLETRGERSVHASAQRLRWLLETRGKRSIHPNSRYLWWLLETRGKRSVHPNSRYLWWLLETWRERAVHSSAWRLRRLLDTRWERTRQSCDWYLWSQLERGGSNTPCPWGWWEGWDRWQWLLGCHM